MFLFSVVSYLTKNSLTSEKWVRGRCWEVEVGNEQLDKIIKTQNLIYGYFLSSFPVEFCKGLKVKEVIIILFSVPYTSRSPSPFS